MRKKLSNGSLVPKYTSLEFISYYFSPISQGQIYSQNLRRPITPKEGKKKNSEAESQVREVFGVTQVYDERPI